MSLNAIIGNDGIINQAMLANIESKFATYKEEFETSIVSKAEGDREKVNLLNDNVKSYIPNLKDEDIGRFGIVDGKLYFLGDDETEKKAARSQDIEVMSDDLTVDEFLKELEKTIICNIIKNTSEESEKEGIKLITKNQANAASWKIVTETVEGKIVEKYQDGWYYIKKGTEIKGIGNLNNGYIINYETKEVKNFEEEKHKLLSYEDVLGYSRHLILNIDPRSNGRI